MDAPRDMVAEVWHGGGGVSHDVNWLYIDATELGSVGDNRGKSAIYKVPLLKGRHKVRWVLTGGTFRTNLLAIVDPDSGKLLSLTGDESPADKATPKEQKIHVKGRQSGWPLIDVKWLPPAVREMHGKSRGR